MSSRRFDRFLAALGSVRVSDRACNQYSRIEGDLAGNAIRRRNLRLYLQDIDRIGPRVLLVGEAPSHRGGRLTGIAFVSETILLGGAGPLLGADRGYRKATPGPRLSTEASATMVWQTIRSIDPLPLLWNAFPFHPFPAGNPLANRAPTASELSAGAMFISWILRLFPIESVVAVGNHAAASLTQMEVAHTKIRHPSQGGKVKFVEGLRQVVEE